MQGLISTPDTDLIGNSAPNEIFVVGIGASAGGIQALSRFFERVSRESEMAYVVILHLSPDHDSQLAAILQNVSSIPVTQVTEQVKIEPNHVYVVPPNQHLEMVDEHITVSPNTLVEDRRAPVDIFFRSLAESYQSRAVAVILSGTGANGSMGMKRVKERGGAVFVQSPHEAEFDEMPRNSIATNLVDEVLPVAEIPARILAYKQRLGSIRIPVEPENRPNEQQQALREIFTQLRVRTGHDFSNYKRPTVLRRIERRVNVRNLLDVPAYATFLSEHPDEAQALLKDLLISVTNFFRDPTAFEAIERDIIPRLLTNSSLQPEIRVWVAGCATGEEAYSIAMLLAEAVQGVIDAPQVQIFATDIDEDAIATAREGLYTLNDAADISPERLRRFFQREGDCYRVRNEIREMVLFAQHNVIKDPPFSHLALVTCRNLLIYFNTTAQERAMETFHFALDPGGYLFLGTAESVDGATDLYAPVSREHHIYQSRQTGARLYPTPETSKTFRFAPNPPREPAPQPANQALERITYGELHQQLLEQYAPPSVVVNESFDIVHLSERAGRYLQVAGGEPSNNLLKLVRPELRLEVRTALYQAVQRGTNVEATNLRLRTEEGAENITVHVRPVLRQSDTARGFLLVVFEPTEATDNGEEAIFTSDEPLARQLEEELVHAKEQLRTVSEQYEVQTEELKASNEELHAMNEELRSAAEELETSREELQSINEELRTVNQELKVKVDEVTQTSNNFQNLINSTDIGTIFLDRSLNVRLFTPAAREIFNLLPADFGRPLSNLTNQLIETDLMRDAETVLSKLQPLEREVSTTDQRVFVMRISPYRTAEDRINGVVLTFVDITRRKQAEDARRGSEKDLKAITDLVPDLLWSNDAAGSTDWYNQSWLEYTGQSLEAAVGSHWLECVHPDDREASQRAFLGAVETGEPLRQEHRIRSASGEYRWFLVQARPLRDEAGQILRWFGAATDIDDIRQTQTQLRESEEHLRMVVGSVTEYAIIATNDNGTITSWNLGAQRLFGYEEAEVLGQSIALIFTPEDRAAGAHIQEMDTARTTGRALDERWHLHKDGTRFYVSGALAPLRDERGLSGYVKIARDLTDQQQAGLALRDSEARFRTLSNAVPQIIWTNEAGGKANYFNQRWFDYTGLPYENSAGLGWQAIVHPDDEFGSVARWHRALSRGEVFETEYRLRRADGAYRWHIGRNVPLLDDQGRISGWFGTATDVEDLKETTAELQQAREELEARVEERTRELARALEQRQHEALQRLEVEVARAKLVRRIVTTQEEERGRISRELHDNLGQHLTGLMLGLQALEMEIGDITGGKRQSGMPQLAHLRTLVDELMKVAHRQAWELRPAELDSMGVEAALGQYVRDWSQRTGVPIDFQAIGWEDRRPALEIETTLYRVVQEALANVVRHAEATQVDVVLELTASSASAIVEDNGRGFEPEKISGRLGILGMRERLSIVGGTLDIESAPGGGTTVFARVPLLSPPRAVLEEDAPANTP